MPVNTKPSAGTWFHSLHATSHALQPMHTDVSVKNPTRADPDSSVTSRVRSGLCVDARPSLILLDERCSLLAARTAAGSDVACECLHLLDVDVRIQGEVGELGGRIAGHASRVSPVVRKSDLIHDSAVDLQRRQ